ncbi:hypothetical protein AMTR_s00035p00172730, partial [Amborella trichopoda]
MVRTMGVKGDGEPLLRISHRSYTGESRVSRREPGGRPLRFLPSRRDKRGDDEVEDEDEEAQTARAKEGLALQTRRSHE